MLLWFFVDFKLSPIDGIVAVDRRRLGVGGEPWWHLKASIDLYPTPVRHAAKGHIQTFNPVNNLSFVNVALKFVDRSHFGVVGEIL